MGYIDRDTGTVPYCRMRREAALQYQPWMHCPNREGAFLIGLVLLTVLIGNHRHPVTMGIRGQFGALMRYGKALTALRRKRLYLILLYVEVRAMSAEPGPEVNYPSSLIVNTRSS